MTRASYGVVAMALSWLLAALIVGALFLGWYMADLPFSLARLRLFNWHKCLGMTILMLAALRLLWRLRNPPPAFPRAIPLLGWAHSNATSSDRADFGKGFKMETLLRIQVEALAQPGK